MISKKIIISFILLLCVAGITRLNAQVEVISTGTGSAYVLNVPAVFPLRNGVQVTFKANVACAASPTIDVTGTGAILIKKEGGTINLAAGDIKAGQVVTLAYDGTFWQMLTGLGNAPAVASPAWGLTGNTGTVDGTNYIGTTDDIAFNIKVNSQKAGRISNSTGSTAFFGYQAGNTTTGIENSAFGHQALFSNTSGYQNSAVGFKSLYSNTTGYTNTAFGSSALFSNTTAFQNIALGYDALFNNMASSQNVAIGSRALYSQSFTTAFASENVAIGTNALYSNNPTSTTNGYRNTAVGHNSLFSNSTGYFNTATGCYSLLSNTTGIQNTATGYSALNSNSTGSGNTANGHMSLFSNTGSNNTATGASSLANNSSGAQNTAIGTSTLSQNTIGSNNTALGFNSLSTNVAGNFATAIGVNAMRYANNTAVAFSNYSVAVGFEALRGSVTAANNTGNQNTAVGYQALQNNTSGANNTAFGSQALYSNNTGSNNTASGNIALFYNTIGVQNTAYGGAALMNNVAGSSATAIGHGAMANANNSTTAFTNYNVAVGFEALKGSATVSANTGNINTAIGFQSLFGITSGNNNVALGYLSGNTSTGSNALTTGSNNTFIGVNTGFSSPTQRTNAAAIGYNAKVDASNALVLGGTGVDAVFVGLNTTAPTERLDVVGNLKFSGALMPNNNAGTPGQVLTSSGPGVAPTWNASSGGLSGGTINYLPKWTSATSLSSTSLVYDDGANVGIGTATPSSQFALYGVADPLQITVENGGGGFKTGYRIKTATNEWFIGQETAAAGEFRIRHITPNQVRFEIDASGNVGIGTTSPQTKLHVAGSNPSSIINQVAENDSSKIQSGIIMQRSRGSISGPSAVAGGDQLGGFYMMGFDGLAFGPNGPSAGMYAVANQSFTPGANGTNLYFETTADNTNSSSTRMAINANGDVGIGTSFPNQKLEIQDGHILLSNTGTQSELRFKEASANGGQIISFKAPAALAANVNYTLPADDGAANNFLSTDGTGILSWQTVSGTLSGGTVNYLPKWNSPNSLSSSSQVYDDGSKVGIGTNAPGEKLQVVSATAAGDNAGVSVMAGTSGKASYFLGSSSNGYLGAIQYDNSNNSMNFWTNNTTNRLVINNSGNIGVGTSTPTTKIHSRGDLQIEDPSNAAGVVFNMATLGDGINPVNGTGTKGWQWLAYGNGNGTVAVQNDMRLTWYNGTGTSPFLYFDNTNKLGINMPLTTDQPLYDLDVAGTIRTGYAGKDGQLRIYSEQGATDFEATFSPSVAMTQNTVYLLPPNDGNPNDILTSNGSGTLTWNPVSALGLSGSGTTNYLARWTPSGTQLGIGATYDNGTNVGIGTASPGQKLHITDVVNGPKIRLEGPVAGASAMNSTLEFYETSTFKASMGWASQSTQQYWFVYEGGTTSMVSKGANIGIGTVTPGTSRLNVVIPNTDALNPIGLTVTNNYTGASAKYGIDVNVDGAGSGVKYGISSSVIGLAADASSIYGYQVAMTPNGTGSTYGVFSDIAAAGTGIRYGIYNNTTAISTNASTIYGIYNISSKPTGSTGTVYGLRSAANHNGTGTSYGIYSTNTGTAASRFGVYVTGETQNYFSGDVGIGTTAPTSALEVVGNVEIPAANDYLYSTPKTDYISLSSASFTTINALAVDGNGTGNARWISSGVAGVSDNMFATLNLPNGATITNVDVYVYDNDATYEVSANLVRNNLVSNINGTLATTTTTGAAAVPGLAVVSASLSSVVDNSIYMYYLKFNTRQNNTNLWIRGAIVTYTVTKTD